MPNNPVISIPIGGPTVVVSAATGNAAQPILFSFQPLPGGGNFNVMIVATGTFSAASGALGVSPDGGTTFKAFQAAYDFAATPVQLLTGIVAGVVYQYTTSGFTGTSVTLTVFRN